MVIFWAWYSKVNISKDAASKAVSSSGEETFFRRAHTKSVRKVGCSICPTLWNQKDICEHQGEQDTET